MLLERQSWLSLKGGRGGGGKRGKDVAARDVQDVHPAIRSGTNEPCIFVRANIF